MKTIEQVALVGADVLALGARGLRVAQVERELGNLAACVREADLVVEALSEQPEHWPVKSHVLREIDALTRPDTLLVSQRGPWLVEDFAELLAKPARLIGVHLPDPKASLVEVSGHRQSDPLTIEALWRFFGGLDFTTLAVADAPGGVVHRLAIPYFNEAARLVAEGHTVAQVESAARRAFGTSAGPFAVMERLGVDAVRHAAEQLGQAWGAFYAPPACLAAQATSTPQPVPQAQACVSAQPHRADSDIFGGAPKIIAERLWGVAMHVALDMISEHVTSPHDIDVGACAILGWARGPFTEMQTRGPLETARLAVPVQARYRLWAPAALQTMCQLESKGSVDASVGRC